MWGGVDSVCDTSVVFLPQIKCLILKEFFYGVMGFCDLNHKKAHK